MSTPIDPSGMTDEEIRDTIENLQRALAGRVTEDEHAEVLGLLRKKLPSIRKQLAPLVDALNTTHTITFEVTMTLQGDVNTSRVVTFEDHSEVTAKVSGLGRKQAVVIEDLLQNMVDTDPIDVFPSFGKAYAKAEKVGLKAVEIVTGCGYTEYEAEELVRMAEDCS